jgi:hypothetical protein
VSTVVKRCFFGSDSKFGHGDALVPLIALLPAADTVSPVFRSFEQGSWIKWIAHSMQPGYLCDITKSLNVERPHAILHERDAAVQAPTALVRLLQPAEKLAHAIIIHRHVQVCARDAHSQ